MNKIFIDTDVILDFFFDRKPFSDDATKLFMLCEKKVVSAFVTPVILSNVYYLLRKTAKHEKVMEKLKILISLIEIATINKATIVEAINSEFKDFEDALQNFSAEQNKDIQVLVTRNVKNFKRSRLTVMNPETYLRSINMR